MSYCKAGVKATVYYSVNGINKIYSTNKTPIDVVVTEDFIPGFINGQCNKVLYRVYCEYNRGIFPRGNDLTFSDVLVYGTIYDAIPNLIGFNDSNNYSVYYELVCHGFYFSGYKDEVTNYRINNSFYVLTPYIKILNIVREDEQNINCGDPKRVCKITVLHNNQILFTDKGNCPITFSVVCGDGCPPGTIKCFSTNYPGYCCLPCSEIKNEIKAIASQIRGINNG